MELKCCEIKHRSRGLQDSQIRVQLRYEHRILRFTAEDAFEGKSSDGDVEVLLSPLLAQMAEQLGAQLAAQRKKQLQSFSENAHKTYQP